MLTISNCNFRWRPGLSFEHVPFPRDRPDNQISWHTLWSFVILWQIIERWTERVRKKKSKTSEKKNATCVRLYVLYNINAHHSRLCTWSPWKILLNDVCIHTRFCFTILLDPHTKYRNKSYVCLLRWNKE